MKTDLFSNLEFLVRWLHVFVGILWIGHLYFFNFVNLPFQGTMDKDLKRKVNPQLMPRALFFFRWGAMLTFLAGLVLFTMNYMYAPGLGFGPTSNFDFSIGRPYWILLGMLLGTIMWFNVWFVIWPAQQKLIAWVRDGQSPPEMPGLAKRAATASRINTYLSGPMLFGMLGAQHYSSWSWLVGAIAVALGLVAIWHSYGHSRKVKGF
jgi:uncharacterized membrane protein